MTFTIPVQRGLLLAICIVFYCRDVYAKLVQNPATADSIFPWLVNVPSSGQPPFPTLLFLHGYNEVGAVNGTDLGLLYRVGVPALCNLYDLGGRNAAETIAHESFMTLAPQHHPGSKYVLPRMPITMCY